MVEPVAYIVTDDLTGKKVGVYPDRISAKAKAEQNDNNLTARGLFTREQLKPAQLTSMTLEEVGELNVLTQKQSSVYRALQELERKKSRYPLLAQRYASGGVITAEQANQFAELFLKFDFKTISETINILPKTFDLKEDDLVIRKGANEADIKIVGGVDYKDGKPSSVLLINGKADEFFANPDEEIPQGGDCGTMTDFFNQFRLLAKKENLETEK